MLASFTTAAAGDPSTCGGPISMSNKIFLKTFMNADDYDELCEEADKEGISPNQMLAKIVTEYVRLGKWRSDYVPLSHRAEVPCTPEEDS